MLLIIEVVLSGKLFIPFSILANILFFGIAIYEISCKHCSNVYVVETGRCFNTRLSEHRRDLKPINLAKLIEDDLNKKNCIG